MAVPVRVLGRGWWGRVGGGGGVGGGGRGLGLGVGWGGRCSAQSLELLYRDADGYDGTGRSSRNIFLHNYNILSLTF